MNKKKVAIISALSCVAIAAAGAFTLFGGDIRKSIDNGIGQSSVPVVGDGGMEGLIQGGPKFQAALNQTKTCVATISPADATDKTILWTTSDPAKVTIATTTTQSGANQTITLKAIFNGTVSVTATAEANSAAKVVFTVSVYNFVTTLEYVGVQDATSGDVITAFPGKAADDIAGTSVLYQTGSASSPTVSFAYSDNEGANQPSIILRAYGRDTAILPDLKSTSGVYVYHTAAELGLTPVGHEAYFAVSLASGWVVGAKTYTIEDASRAVTLAAYVAPASMSGSGDTQFK